LSRSSILVPLTIHSTVHYHLAQLDIRGPWVVECHLWAT